MIEVSAASEYISKGAGRSDGEPHLGLMIQRGLGDGLYAGAWTGSLRSPLGANAESNLYAGWRGKAEGWTLEVRPMFKVLSGAREGDQSEQWEFRFDVSRPLAGNRLRLRTEHTFNGYGAAQGSTWMEASVSHPVGDSDWTAVGAVGQREQEVGRDYTAWNLGVQRRLNEDVAVDLRWLDTDQNDAGREYDGRLVLGLTVSLR